MQAQDEQSQSQEPEYEGLDFDQYKTWWRESVDNYSDARKQHIRDEEYYDGDIKGTGWGHWTQDQLTKLTGRNQPPTTRNMIADEVNAICGVEQRSRSEPRALPRTPKDQKSAEIATDALRYIKDQTRWTNAKSEKVLEAVKVGYAAVEIGGAEDRVPITPIAWKDFFFDPRSRMFDFSDARYLGIAKWLDEDVAVATYAGPPIKPPQFPPQPQVPPQPQDQAMAAEWARMAQSIIGQWQAQAAAIQAAHIKEVDRRAKIVETIETTIGGGGSDRLGVEEDNFEDRPSTVFCDQKRRRVFVIDMWHQDQKHGWYRCVFTGNGKLFSEPAKFIEMDEWGRKRPTHPIKAFSIHVSKDLWRSGEVRGMRSTQDEVNFRLSKKLHYLATNQLFYEPGAFEDGNVESVRAEINRPDGVVAVRNINGYRVEKNLDVAMALDAAHQEAMRFLDRSGANEELQGRGAAGQSGRAIMARQQAGLGKLGPLFDRIHDWELRCYRAMWARVQQFWTGPMYVRVTDDKNAARFAAVNGAPVINKDNGAQPQGPGIGHNGGPGGDPLAPAMPPQMPQGGPRMGGAAMMPPQGGPEMGAMPGMLGMQPQEPEETGPMLADLDMDIIIDRAPEAATLQAEQFESLTQLAAGGALGPPGNPDVARMLITASSLPNKSELLDMLDKMAAKPQGPSPEQKAQLATLAKKLEQIVAQTNKTRAETAKIAAEIPGAQAEAQLTQAQARTETVNATMTEFSAEDALALRGLMQSAGGAPAYDFAPQAAAGLPGASGLPPTPANGPPPF